MSGTKAALSRNDAELLVRNVTRRVEQFAFVADDEARHLLGDADFARMKSDAIRSLGPRPNTTYPWNVVDYLSGYRTKFEIQWEANHRSEGP